MDNLQWFMLRWVDCLIFSLGPAQYPVFTLTIFLQNRDYSTPTNSVNLTTPDIQ